ncbi:MAG: hypothetical protein ACRDDJ_19145, partial [[Mycobacterium] stephanolepidis]
MAAQSFNPKSIKTSGAVTLALGQRTSSDPKGCRVKMKLDVVEALRKIASETVEMLAARSAVQYADDLDFNAEENYILIQRGALVVHRPAPRRGRGAAQEKQKEQEVPAQLEMSPAILEIVDAASSLEQINREDLVKKAFSFYAAVIGDDPDRRTAFITQSNPYKAAQTGHLSTLFGDGLAKVTDPILTFALRFDMVVTPEHVAVLNLTAFERLFREIDSMKARVPVWSEAAIKALPLDEDSAETLRTKAVSSARVATQLRGLYER